ncbi:hypothetical protein BFP70_08370 [Thioclava sp. SK-1]|uniref:hypothetical protein n=1 Tax=Thioclava sp. SK-1 TaxID=1889770 RepID=UPI000823FA11|nr:hypothetical protein [Thioclava sp. SK-1]OCX66114.1 hypothetical protein BFP70_08370 [Thioclava sp. SK-1]
MYIVNLTIGTHTLHHLRAALLMGGLMVGTMIAAQPAAAGDPLEAAFRSLPESRRVAVQKELLYMDLFTGVSNGRWSSGTKRALLRGVEEVKLRSNLHIKPKLRGDTAIRDYFENLETGAYREVFQKDDDDVGISWPQWSFLTR